MSEEDKGNPIAQFLLRRALPWLITLGCFYFLYTRIAGPASAQGVGVIEYLASIFAQVNWIAWLSIMIPYSIAFFLIDSLVVWRSINWFNVKIKYTEILPVRASAYIISILNEQVGKGAMALYLYQKKKVPGWQLGSTMLFIMVCELLYLCFWANFGLTLQWDNLPEVFHLLPWVGLGLIVAFAIGYLYFRGYFLKNWNLRDVAILRAFREATVMQYITIMVFRSPAFLLAVIAYAHCLELFGIEITYLMMLGVLPVIFFGAAIPGPFRAVAISMWVILFPEHPAEMSAFGLVQHNFFILFNALIGVVFLGRAQRDIFDESESEADTESEPEETAARDN